MAEEALKMETVCFPKTMVSVYQSKWHQNPEERNIAILTAVRTSNLTLNPCFILWFNSAVSSA
jgi:hypothetical protein